MPTPGFQTSLPLLLGSALVFTSTTSARPPSPNGRLAEQAIAGDPDVANSGRHALRALGPEGLDALLETPADLLARGPGNPEWPPLRCCTSTSCSTGRASAPPRA